MIEHLWTCAAAQSDAYLVGKCTCLPAATVDVTPDPGLEWVTLVEVPAPIVWPWWLAVPAARVRRWFAGVWG